MRTKVCSVCAVYKELEHPRCHRSLCISVNYVGVQGHLANKGSGGGGAAGVGVGLGNGNAPFETTPLCAPASLRQSTPARLLVGLTIQGTFVAVVVICLRSLFYLSRRITQMQELALSRCAI